jgi:hypothetical protein
VRKGKKLVSHLAGSARSGRNNLSWKTPKKLKAGAYSLKLTARGTDGQTATDSAKLTLRKR